MSLVMSEWSRRNIYHSESLLPVARRGIQLGTPDATELYQVAGNSDLARLHIETRTNHQWTLCQSRVEVYLRSILTLSR
jgi:hypothetical protein